MPQPWFQDGLRFTCTGCGNCCTGAPGYVWVREEDIERLAAHLGLDVDAFERRYVRRVGIRKSLIEYSDGDCVFFDPQKRNCSVYEARPLQCRTWPFWDSNIKSQAAWKHTCEVCPGSGKGTLYPVEKILEQAAAMKL
jgi:Fe-S-cluster containining protein